MQDYNVTPDNDFERIEAEQLDNGNTLFLDAQIIRGWIETDTVVDTEAVR